MQRILTILIAILLLCSIAEAGTLYGGTARQRVIFMGDSITRGGDSNDYACWRDDLQANLRYTINPEGQYEMPSPPQIYDVAHSGVSGETSAEIKARLQTNLDTYLPKDGTSDKGIVLWMSGTNDGIYDAGLIDAGVEHIRQAIGIVYDYDQDIKMFIGMIPPIADDALNGRTTNFNDDLIVMVRTAQTTWDNLHLVDNNAAIDEDVWGYCDGGNWKATCYELGEPDTTHPALEGNKAIGRQWYECLTRPLAGVGCDDNIN